MTIAIKSEELNTIHSIITLVEDSYVGLDCGKVIKARGYIPEHPIKRAYLIISATLTSPFNTMNKWKIVMNGVAITREYNPHIEKSFSNLIHSAFVYDVTTTIKDPRVELSITYDGKERIRIDTATLISIHSYESIHTMLEGYIDITPLDKEVTYHYSAPSSFNPNEGCLYSALSALKTGSVTIIEKSAEGQVEHNHDVLLNPGLNLIEAPLKCLGSSDIVFQPISNTVKHVYTLRVLTRASYPRIEVEGPYVEGDTLSLYLKNLGESAADNVMVIALRLGTVLARANIGALKAGEQKQVNLKIPARARPSHIRIVWKKGSRIFTYDIRF